MQQQKSIRTEKQTPAANEKREKKRNVSQMMHISIA